MRSKKKDYFHNVQKGGGRRPATLKTESTSLKNSTRERRELGHRYGRDGGGWKGRGEGQRGGREKKKIHLGEGRRWGDA